jgi:hypothetical protein
MGDGWGDNSAPNIVNDDDAGRRKDIFFEGRTFIMQAKDPFGFWYVKMPEGGKPPNDLSGAYTGVWECEKDIKQWCSQNPLSPALREAREAGTTPPKLETKKRLPVERLLEERQPVSEELIEEYTAETPPEQALFTKEEKTQGTDKTPDAQTPEEKEIEEHHQLDEGLIDMARKIAVKG